MRVFNFLLAEAVLLSATCAPALAETVRRRESVKVAFHPAWPLVGAVAVLLLAAFLLQESYALYRRRCRRRSGGGAEHGVPVDASGLGHEVGECKD